MDRSKVSIPTGFVASSTSTESATGYAQVQHFRDARQNRELDRILALADTGGLDFVRSMWHIGVDDKR